MSFSVLFVCTGNICRSPMAERLFRLRVGLAAPVLASSAGVNGLTGWPMDAPSAAVLQELGGDPQGHVAHRLDVHHIKAADLILTAEAGHRAVVLQSDPLAFRRAFTFREFGRLGSGLGPLDGKPSEGGLRERVNAVAGQRGLLGAVEPGADDIADPFRAQLTVVRDVGHQVLEAVNMVIAALGLAPDRLMC